MTAARMVSDYGWSRRRLARRPARLRFRLLQRRRWGRVGGFGLGWARLVAFERRLRQAWGAAS